MAKIDELRRKMEAMPPIDRQARRLARHAAEKAKFERLKAAIGTFQEHGYTLEQIARFFRDPGPPAGTPLPEHRSPATRAQKRAAHSVAQQSDRDTGGDDGEPFGPTHET